MYTGGYPEPDEHFTFKALFETIQIVSVLLASFVFYSLVEKRQVLKDLAR